MARKKETLIGILKLPVTALVIALTAAMLLGFLIQGYLVGMFFLLVYGLSSLYIGFASKKNDLDIKESCIAAIIYGAFYGLFSGLSLGPSATVEGFILGVISTIISLSIISVIISLLGYWLEMLVLKKGQK